MSEDKQEEIECPQCQDQAASITDARADVIRLAGFVAVGMLPLLTILSFADAVLNKHAWQPETSVVTGVITAFGGIMVFAFKTKK